VNDPEEALRLDREFRGAAAAEKKVKKKELSQNIFFINKLFGKGKNEEYIFYECLINFRMMMTMWLSCSMMTK
jgi:hypothetical protein